MDETPLNPPMNDGKTTVKRDSRGRVVKGAATLNPTGNTGPKQLTAQMFIDSMFKTLGPKATDKIFKVAMAKCLEGDYALMCKILDKILPSKTESKVDATVTHREEFLKMRARAMEILESYKGRAN